MKQEIEQRQQLMRGMGVLRLLKCGHTQKEPHGGKAMQAKFAQCGACDKLTVNNAVTPDAAFPSFKPHAPDPVDG